MKALVKRRYLTNHIYLMDPTTTVAHDRLPTLTCMPVRGYWLTMIASSRILRTNISFSLSADVACPLCGRQMTCKTVRWIQA